MKKTLFLILLILSCLFTGCGNKPEKMCRIEIRNENHSNVILLEDQSQTDIIAFFDEDNWIACEDLEEKLISEYIIDLYQEKTPTHALIRSTPKDSYEKIMEYTTYKDSDIVQVVIQKAAIKGSFLEEALTFYYVGSEAFFSSLYHMTESYFLPESE